MRRGTISTGAILGAVALGLGAPALAAPTASAAVHERVKVSIPDPGQLAAVRLQFKVEGEKKPKLKARLKNADALSDGVIAAVQMTRSTEKNGRAVALMAIGNVPPSAAARKAPRVTGESAVVDVRSAGTRTRISDIDFQNLPSASRNFVSVLGLEPGVERQQAQEVFDLPENRIPDDPFGRFDLSGGLNVMDLNLVQESKIVTQSTFQQDVEELFRERSISSAIAAAVGPPAALDANVYAFVFGMPPPLVIQSTFGPSPSNPSLYFTGVEFNLPVMGAQISQASDLDLLDTADARCQNGLLGDGLFKRGTGPLLTFGFSYRFDCDLPQDHPVVSADVPLEGTPSPGIDVMKLMPFPYYGSDEIGEAVGGEQTTVLIKGK